MTAEQLRRIAAHLGNSCWCRHWLHWSYPRQDPWLMAISCLDYHGEPVPCDLESRGFTRHQHDRLIIYTIHRVDDAGSPFRSRLL